MWQLKFQHVHKDCLYLRQLQKLRLTMYGYPLNYFKENKTYYFHGLQILHGNSRNIKKYIYYLKNISTIKNIEAISENGIIFKAAIKSNIPYYQSIYNQKMIYLKPIIHKEGIETFEVASWDRKLLEKIIKNIQTNKNSVDFRLHFLKQKTPKEIFLPQILPKLTSNQRRIVTVAKERGYWEYPRMITLDALAKELKLSKSSLHETLRRAEVKILNFFI